MSKFKEYSLTKTTEELKKLILENPDLPIAVLAGEDANIGDEYWMFCSRISFSIGEILDYDYYDYGGTVFTEREMLVTLDGLPEFSAARDAFTSSRRSTARGCVP